MNAYPASKNAVAKWVRRNAVTPEWGGSGITLNAVAPGMIATPMIEEGRTDPMIKQGLEMFEGTIAVGRPGRPEEIAGLIAYLLGPEARFFCGSIVYCDGGTDALFRANDWPGPLGARGLSPRPPLPSIVEAPVNADRGLVVSVVGCPRARRRDQRGAKTLRMSARKPLGSDAFLADVASSRAVA